MSEKISLDSSDENTEVSALWNYNVRPGVLVE